MGKDYRGNFRQECLVKDCDCDEFEASSNAEDDSRYNCNYCGCPPAKHKRCNPPGAARSSGSDTVTASSPENLAPSCPVGFAFYPSEGAEVDAYEVRICAKCPKENMLIWK